MSLAPDTEQVKSDANPDGSKSEEEVKATESTEVTEVTDEEVKTGEDTETEEEVEEDPNAQYVKKPDETGSEKPDATIAKTAYELREERRKRKALEEKLADIEAGTIKPELEKPVLPDRSNFEDDTAYNQAMGQYTENLTDYKIAVNQAKTAHTSASAAQSDSLDDLEASYMKQAEEAVKEYPDFFERVEATDFTTVIRDSIFAADNKAKIAYHLTHNDALRNKLIRSNPVMVVREITKLDDKFTRSLKGKKRTETPAPIGAVKATTQSGSALSKPIKEMSASEYYDAKQAGLIKETD